MSWFSSISLVVVLRYRRLFVGRIFVSIFSFSFFYLWSSAKYLPGGNASDRFFSAFSCLAKRLFWLCFPCSLGSGVPGLGLVFLACVTHPIFGPGLALLGAVSPIPFWGQVRFFLVWSPGFFGPFPPVSIVSQDFLVSFSCGFGPGVFVRTFCYSFSFRSSFLWRVGPCG